MDVHLLGTSTHLREGQLHQLIDAASCPSPPIHKHIARGCLTLSFGNLSQIPGQDQYLLHTTSTAKSNSKVSRHKTQMKVQIRCYVLKGASRNSRKTQGGCTCSMHTEGSGTDGLWQGWRVKGTWAAAQERNSQRSGTASQGWAGALPAALHQRERLYLH